MQTTFFQKSFSWTLVASMVLWAVSGVLLSMQYTPFASAASAGDLIKKSGLSSVYYYGSDGKRYVFPNEKTYMTWYSDFSGVVTISDSELGSIAIGGNVVYRPGTRLVKITTDPSVYAVTPGGNLHHIPDEATASKLYGSNWSQMIDDVPDAFFTNYSVGSGLGSMHPEGTIISYDGSADRYYIDSNGNKRLITDDGFSANGFQSGFVVSGFDQGLVYADGSSISGEESDISDTAQLSSGGGSSSSAAGTLSVAMAGDTPAAGTVVPNAAKVLFTKFSLSASADGDATVDSIKVKRAGLCTNTNFQDLLLLDSDLNQIGNEKSLGSTDMATFGDNLTIPAGMTKHYYLAANMASSVNAAENCSLGVYEVDATGSTSVSGSLPFYGNEMTTNGTITIGTVTVAAGGLDPSASTQKVGTTDYTVSAVKVTAGSAEDIELTKLSFYQNGSAGTDDTGNYVLVADGVVVKTISSISGKDLVFDFSSSPIKITKGNNKEFSLRLDILDGSNRDISFDFERKTAVQAKGLKFGFFIDPSYPNSSAPYYNANNTTIGGGSVTVSKGTLASTNVAEGASRQILGAYKWNVQGEPMTITQFVVDFAVSGTGNPQDITNVVLVDPNGNVVAGPVDPSTTGDSATSTDTFVVPVGISTYTLEGDLNSDFAANDTIVPALKTPATAITAKGEITNNTITATPASNLTGDTITVQVGKMNVSTLATPAAQTVIIGSSGFTFASFVLDASDSGEDVRVNQMAIRHTSTASAQTNIANLQFFHDDGTPINPIVQPTAGTTVPATSTFTFTNPITVPKGTSKTVHLKGDIVTGNANEAHAFGCVAAACVTAVGADTANSITATVSNSDGQEMTLATAATVTIADDASDPNNSLAAAGSTGVTVGQVRVTATNGDADLTELQVQMTALNSGGVDEVDKLYLYNGATKISEVSPTSTTVVFPVDAGDFRVPAGSTGAKLTIKADFANIGTGFTGGSGQGFNLTIGEDDYTFRDVSSGADIAAGSTSGTFTGSEFTIYKSLPIVTQQSIGTTLSNGSNQVLYKFTVAADSAGDIGLYKATFEVTTDTASVTNFQLFEDPAGARINLTNNATRGVSEVVTTSEGANSGTHNVEILIDTGTDGVGRGGEYRQIAAGATKTFQLEATISGAVSNSSATVKLLSDNAFPATYPQCAGTTGAGGNVCAGIDSDDEDNFIWSDLNVGNNSSTATNTAEWVSGYRVFSTTTGSTLTK